MKLDLGIKPYYSTDRGDLYNCDCLDILPLIPDKSVDLCLTDPPYPDYHTEEYSYKDGIIDPLKELKCRQLVFWSAKVDFPLDYTAIHIWDKKLGCGSVYERLFERNGGKQYNVYRFYLVNSTVSCSFTGDVLTGHPSQKPIKLISTILKNYSKDNDLILDPFSGSGTTAVACEDLNRRWICIEKEEKYCELSAKRIEQFLSQGKLF